MTTTCALFVTSSLLAAEKSVPLTPKRGGVLHMAIESDQRTLDPAQLFSGHEGMLAQLVFNFLFRSASTEPDAGRRLRLYQEVEEGIVREAPWIFLVHLNDDHLRQPWLKGYLHRPIWPNARLENCWIER